MKTTALRTEPEIIWLGFMYNEYSACSVELLICEECTFDAVFNTTSSWTMPSSIS